MTVLVPACVRAPISYLVFSSSKKNWWHPQPILRCFFNYYFIIIICFILFVLLLLAVDPPDLYAEEKKVSWVLGWVEEILWRKGHYSCVWGVCGEKRIERERQGRSSQAKPSQINSSWSCYSKTSLCSLGIPWCCCSPKIMVDGEFLSPTSNKTGKQFFNGFSLALNPNTGQTPSS